MHERHHGRRGRLVTTKLIHRVSKKKLTLYKFTLLVQYYVRMKFVVASEIRIHYAFDCCTLPKDQ